MAGRTHVSISIYSNNKFSIVLYSTGKLDQLAGASKQDVHLVKEYVLIMGRTR